jgi:hypothetical protein
MNSKQIGTFLQSMGKSCDIYSENAMLERRKLREVNGEFKAIEKVVDRTLNVTKRKPPVPDSYHSNQKSRPSTRQKEETEDMVIRPAPFPVRNYILPAHQLIGPRRFFRSRAAQQIKEDARDEELEVTRYPSLQRPKTAMEPHLPLQVTHIRGPVYKSRWDDDDYM